METLAERVKILEDKIQKLEGENLSKDEPKKLYKTKSTKEVEAPNPKNG